MAITELMFGLVLVNQRFIETYPRTPMLYDSGVLYRMEHGTEIWQDIPSLIMSRFGDCEDLACWRAAELRVEGIDALPYITWRKASDKSGTIYHALVRHPKGLIEDPSRALGMRGHPIVKRPVYIDLDPFDGV